MPRYFFTIEDGLCIPDFGGTDLRDLAAARTEAARRCHDFPGQQPAAFAAGGPWRMDVTEDWGVLLFSQPFGARGPDPASPADAFPDTQDFPA